MSAPKPRIKPKGAPDRQAGESATRDAPLCPERDPPVLEEHDPQTAPNAPERVLFHEDDCLR